MEPVVSVVVPVHNGAAHLRQCVDSLVSQTLREIEIILVNGASTDESLTILRKYERRYPDKVVVIDSEVDLGPGGHRNLGIKAARADYIGFVDADDWVEVTMFAKMYEKALNTDCDVVHCFQEEDVELHGERRVLRDNSPSERTLALEGKPLDDSDRATLCLPGGASGGITQQLYRKSIIVSNGLWFPESMTDEDMYFAKLAPFHINSISFVPEYLYHYRIHGDSITHTRNAPWVMNKAIAQCMAMDDINRRGLGGRITEVLEYGFIFGYWLSTTREWELWCDGDLPTATVAEMRKEILRRFPDFRRNRHYRQYASWRERFLANLMMLSPRSYTIGNRTLRCKDLVRSRLVELLRRYPRGYVWLRGICWRPSLSEKSQAPAPVLGESEWATPRESFENE
jgi:glycosyltransferase involved in cell wall biosynthesis